MDFLMGAPQQFIASGPPPVPQPLLASDASPILASDGIAVQTIS